MKYRGRADIVAAILYVARGGAIKTKIMYNAFLSYNQLGEYLEMLTNAEMLEYCKNSREYRLTQKGEYFLTIYERLTELLKQKSSFGSQMPIA